MSIYKLRKLELMTHWEKAWCSWNENFSSPFSLSVPLTMFIARGKKKIQIKQATLRPCAISFKLRLPCLEWQCTITPQIATRGCSKTCLEDYLSRLRLWNGRSSIPCLSERRLCLCNKTFEENMQVLFAFIFQCSPPPPPPRRNVVHGRNLRSNHRISLPRCRTQRFKISFFSGNGLFKIVMHFYIVCIYILRFSLTFSIFYIFFKNFLEYNECKHVVFYSSTKKYLE